MKTFWVKFFHHLQNWRLSGFLREKETQFEHMRDTFLAKIIHRSVREMVFEGRGDQLFTEGGVRLADRQQTHYKECPLAAHCHHSLGLQSLS